MKSCAKLPRILAPQVLVLLTLGSSAHLGLADTGLPVVPGFQVTEYAIVPNPAGLTFSPTGVLYVGNGDNSGPVHVHRVGIGGAPVDSFGSRIYDPDAVQFDTAGVVSQDPGSVLVGVQAVPNQLPGAIKVIHPNGVVTTRFDGTGVFNNPGDMALDHTGRLLFTDVDPARRSILSTSGESPAAFIILPANARPLGIAIDGANRIFTAALDETIRVYASNGDLLNGSFASEMGYAIAFGGCSGMELYAADNDSHLVRIDTTGAVTVIGDGFGEISDLAFGPDGALYVSEYSKNRVLRVIPEPSSLRILTVGADRATSCGTLSWAFTTGNAYTVARSALLDLGNFGPSGIVARQVQFVLPVEEITCNALADADVVLLTAIYPDTLSAAERLILANFVRQGGGLLGFYNEAGVDLAAVFNAVEGGVGSGCAAVSANVPPVVGPFGMTTACISPHAHLFFDSIGPQGVAFMSDGNPVGAFFTEGLGKAILICDDEWFMSTGEMGCGLADLTPNTETLFLNAVAAVMPDSAWAGFDPTTGVQERNASAGTGSISLYTSPNPFRGSTTLRFSVPHPGRGILRIFNVSGCLVATPVDRILPSGTQEILWSAELFHGVHLPSGVYIAEFEVGGVRTTSQMTLLR